MSGRAHLYWYFFFFFTFTFLWTASACYNYSIVQRILLFAIIVSTNIFLGETARIFFQTLSFATRFWRLLQRQPIVLNVGGYCLIAFWQIRLVAFLARCLRLNIWQWHIFPFGPKSCRWKPQLSRQRPILLFVLWYSLIEYTISTLIVKVVSEIWGVVWWEG